MACGTPVITSAVATMPEHVGDAGILIPPQDQQALTDAILTVLNNDELRSELSIKGCRQAANFTWQRAAQETLEVYQRLNRIR